MMMMIERLVQFITTVISTICVRICVPHALTSQSSTICILHTHIYTILVLSHLNPRCSIVFVKSYTTTISTIDIRLWT